MKDLTQEQGLAAIRKAVEAAGTQTAFAKRHGLSPAYISDVLSGRRDPSKAILDAVGLERAITYRKKERADAK